MDETGAFYQYYIAANGGLPMLDYASSSQGIKRTLHNPELWDEATFWNTRRQLEFELGADQFFPMGDNSPASLDARCWAGSKKSYGLPDRIARDAYAWSEADYVPRDLLVGKALLVFWPHPWSRPVPMTPNFKRFKLIR